MISNIHIGDWVSVRDDDIKGSVIAIIDDSVLILDSDGFERSFEVKELIVYNSDLDNDDSIHIKDLTDTKTKKKVKFYPDVVDLHNKNIYTAKNRILENQISLFKKHLNIAIGRRKHSIVFIHGKGEGILKNSIEKILHKNRIKYSEASYQKYGQGAIEVFLSGSNKIIR